MCDESPTSPSFKSALNYFNSLERTQKSTASPITRQTKSSIIELNFKLSPTTTSITTETHSKLIPRPKLNQENRIVLHRNEDKKIVNRPTVPKKPKPKQFTSQSCCKLVTSNEEKLISKIYSSFMERIKDLHYFEPFDKLTPDAEAKQIMKIFKKEISPYNTFEIPFDAIDSDFFKQTLTFVPEVGGDVMKTISSAVRTTNQYQMPRRKFLKQQRRYNL